MSFSIVSSSRALSLASPRVMSSFSKASSLSFAFDNSAFNSLIVPEEASVLFEEVRFDASFFSV